MPSRIIALIFLALSIAFVEQALTNYAFQDWLFARHHNVFKLVYPPAAADSHYASGVVAQFGRG